MSTRAGGGGAAAEEPRWPRRRRRVRDRHDPERWDPERTSEDVPSLAGTVGLTCVGALVFGGLWLLHPAIAAVVYVPLLVWSITVDASGNRVTTRVRGPGIALWAVLRPLYAVGIAVVGLLELLGELLPF